MKSSKRIFNILAFFAIGLIALFSLPAVANAHGGDDQKPKDIKNKTKNKSQQVSIGFTALNGTKPVSCSKPITGLGTTARTARLNDLRFYVTDVRLLRKGGGSVSVKLPTGSKWSYTRGKAALTLIDLENGTGACAAEGTRAMNASVRGTVPKGKYTGVSYSVSVPESLNHTDVTATPSPLNLTAMAWNWQFGHKFMKIEVSEDGGTAWGSKIYYLHVGSTDCVGDPAAGDKAKCGLPNRNQVTLKKFNPAKQKIAIDFKNLFGGVNVAGEDMGMGMSEETDMGMGMEMPTNICMSDTSSPDCLPIFKSLGMKLGTTKKTTQTAFRVVGK